MKKNKMLRYVILLFLLIVLGNILYEGARNTTTYTSTIYQDELGLWNRVLSQAEVEQLYSNGQGIFY